MTTFDKLTARILARADSVMYEARFDDGGRFRPCRLELPVLQLAEAAVQTEALVELPPGIMPM